MGFGNISTPKTESQQATTTSDERIAAADQGVAVRTGTTGGNSQTTLNYAITSADGQLLKDIAAGAAALTDKLATNQSKLADAAIGAVTGVQTNANTGGSSELQKTILIGLGIGAGTIVLINLLRPKAK